MKKKVPEISIVMPVYNAELFLNESIDSILNQTFYDFELLIIDDKSTDQSNFIINRYKDLRIRVLKSRHDFIHSLNMGLKAAKGKYIVRMDADDIMLPNRLKLQYEFMELHPNIDVCGSWAESFGEETCIVQRPAANFDIVSSMLLFNPIIHSSVIMKRSIFSNMRNKYKYDYPYAEDYKLWTDLSIQDFYFANIQEVLIKYRRSKQQVTNVNRKIMALSANRIQLEYGQQMMLKMINYDEKYTDIFNSLIVSYNQNSISKNCFIKILYLIYKDIFVINY